MSFGKDSSLKFVMEGSELVNLARVDVTADKQPLDSVEKEVWRIFGEWQALKQSHEKLMKAMNKIILNERAISNQMAELAIEKETKDKWFKLKSQSESIADQALKSAEVIK